MTNVNYSINEPNIELNESVLDELEDFKEYLEENHESDKTITDYFNYVKRFYAYSYKHHDRFDIIDISSGENEDERLDDINNQMVGYIGSKATEYGLKKYLDFKANRGSKDETRNVEYIRSQIHNTGDSTENRSREDKIKDKIHREKDLIKVIESADEKTEILDGDELKLFLRVMYETAGRFSDIARLEWQDYEREVWAGEDLDENEIFISADRSKSKNSGTVKITDRTRKRVDAFKDDSVNGDERMFFSEQEDLKKLYYRVAPALKRSAADKGVDLKGTHDLRHSRLVKIGKNMAQDEEKDLDYSQIKSRLQSYARHGDEETTEIYIGVLKQRYQIDISEYTEIDDEVVE